MASGVLARGISLRTPIDDHRVVSQAGKGEEDTGEDVVGEEGADKDAVEGTWVRWD